MVSFPRKAPHGNIYQRRAARVGLGPEVGWGGPEACPARGQAVLARQRVLLKLRGQNPAREVMGTKGEVSRCGLPVGTWSRPTALRGQEALVVVPQIIPACVSESEFTADC